MFGVRKLEGREQYYLVDGNRKSMSFWHDVSLKETGYHEHEYNFICEIPMNRLAKLEVDKEKQHNPIVQDTKKHPISLQKVDRYYYIFPEFNYGIIPQTYEAPTPVAAMEGLCGDNDPIDVLELSGKPLLVGDILKVNVFGCLPFIDSGEIDWKVLAIRSDHELAVA